MKVKRILTLVDYYLPGYKAGGALRSVASLTEALGDEFKFLVVTRDRDHGDSRPYAGIECGAWQTLGHAEVLYLSPGALRLRSFRSFLRTTKYDILYLNSLFSPAFSIGPLALHRFGLIPSTPVVLAPRGELSPGAVAIRRAKKEAYLSLSQAADLYRGVHWQASSAFEERDIRRRIRGTPTVTVAPDLPSIAPRDRTLERRRSKEPGRLRLVYVSRISPKKNLDGAITLLAGVRGEVELNVYGPVDDHAYWRRCEAVAHSLPRNIRIRFHGPVPHSEILAAMEQSDLFFFPTHGENFGHVILEALAASCPVLISDQTPWRNLETKHVGWDLPLSEGGQFRRVLEECIRMGPQEFSTWAEAARNYAEEVIRAEEVRAQNRALFHAALGEHRGNRA